MKKSISNIKTLAALLIAGAAFTACSSDDDIVANQPENTTPQQYSLTINATKGGDAQTRALSLDDKTLNATWATSENVYVKKGETWATGSLQPDADGATTTLKGSLRDITIEAGDELSLQFPKSGDISYAGQTGTLDDIAANFDYATATVKVVSVSATGTITPEAATTTFQNQQAIIRFTLKDKGNADAAINPTALTVTDGTSTVELTSIPEATYTTNGQGVLYVAFPAAGEAKTITLTATVGSDTYAYETSTAKTFTNGQYYSITVKMKKESPYKVGWFLNKDGSITATKQTSGDNQSYAVIAYVGTVPNYFSNFIAIALTDCNASGGEGSAQMGWSDALTNVGIYASNHPVTIGGTTYNTSTTGSTYYDQVTHNNDRTTTSATRTDLAQTGWRLPSVTDWRYIFQGLTAGNEEGSRASATDPAGVAANQGNNISSGEGTILRTAINTACQNENLGTISYWSSSYSPRYGGFVWNYNFNDNNWMDSNSGLPCYVRPVFAY